MSNDFFSFVLYLTGISKLYVVGQIVGYIRINSPIKFLNKTLNKLTSEIFYFDSIKALVQSCNFLLWQIFKVFKISIVL